MATQSTPTLHQPVYDSAASTLLPKNNIVEEYEHRSNGPRRTEDPAASTTSDTNTMLSTRQAPSGAIFIEESVITDGQPGHKHDAGLSPSYEHQSETQYAPGNNSPAMGQACRWAFQTLRNTIRTYSGRVVISLIYRQIVTALPIKLHYGADHPMGLQSVTLAGSTKKQEIRLVQQTSSALTRPLYPLKVLSSTLKKSVNRVSHLQLQRRTVGLPTSRQIKYLEEHVQVEGIVMERAVLMVATGVQHITIESQNKHRCRSICR